MQEEKLRKEKPGPLVIGNVDFEMLGEQCRVLAAALETPAPLLLGADEIYALTGIVGMLDACVGSTPSLAERFPELLRPLVAAYRDVAGRPGDRARVVVAIAGGVVQSLTCDDPAIAGGVDVAVVDYDLVRPCLTLRGRAPLRGRVSALLSRPRIARGGLSRGA